MAVNPNCPICSAARLAREPFGYRFEGRWLQAVGCRQCGIIYLDPQPTPEELRKLYSADYFEGDFRCGHAGSYFAPGTLDAVADGRLLDRIQRVVSKGSFLEIGCAGGALLNAARARGFDVTGIEFSDHAAAMARERFRLKVLTGALTEMRLPQNSFDVVFMGDVIEHLPDPLATMHELNRIMRPDGLLAIDCPSQTNTLFSRMGFVAYRMLGKNAEVHLPPYHLFEYRPPSIAHLLEESGFSLLQVVQEILSPSEIHLRGPRMQRVGKKLLHYPNYLVTRVFGVLGDRLEVFARKPREGAFADR
jgi:SAM-dependent methyltransferase